MPSPSPSRGPNPSSGTASSPGAGDATLERMERAELHSLADRLEVAPGVRMPRLGLGTWHAHGRQVERVVTVALQMGYRLIDTSANYYNEEEVGLAVAASGVARDEVFLTTKLEGPDQGHGRTRPALLASLRRLGMDYVDLYLIHWPDPRKTVDAWRELEELVHEGLARSIGVSNFGIRDLEQVFSVADIPPAVNQVELHPLRQRREVQAYCRERGIALEAWAPVMRGYASQVHELVEIGRRHGKTAEQVCLRWLLEKGMIPIPKTVHEERLRENSDVFDFELSDEEHESIGMLEEGRHLVF